jgi:predicted amidohydrolase YtcJ
VDKFEITNCYDSHTHFLATGQIASGLKLNDLTSAEEITQLQIEESHYRGQWLYGFGWNNLNWKNTSWPQAQLLDQVFPHTPVFLSRVDGHSSWINTKAIRELEQQGFNFSQDIPGGRIARNPDGRPSGTLIDQAHIKALMMLPTYLPEQIKQHLLLSIKMFNLAGYTHVRDLSMTFEQAKVLTELYEAGQQTVCVEGFITIESVADLQRGYEELLKIKNLNNPYLRLQGLKIFVDGSLGSETAFISTPYFSKDLNQKNYGLISWQPKDIFEGILFCWSKKIEIAFHTIGDHAADIVVEQARLVSAQKLLGIIHLEHVQLLKPETIQKMKPLHIHCHMQPCHWLSDKSWIHQKIGDHSKYLFQWDQVVKNKIMLSFGSDSPIEKISLFSNWAAIKDAEKHGISPINFKQFQQCHSHPDKKWTASKSIFAGNELQELIFDGKKII